MQEITIDSYYIKPHSVAGETVKIITRHPESPHPVKDTECDFKIYRFRTQDNTEVTIQKSTTEDCMGDEATRKEEGDELNGKRVLVASTDRKHLAKPKKIPHTGTHNTNLILTTKYTYCELHEEYGHILNSKDYMESHKKKIEIVKKIRGS